MKEIIPIEAVAGKIHYIRGHKVILDRDLAELYGVDTKVFKQAVRRNSKRFPEDFMFVLTNQEVSILRSQIVTSKRGGTRYNPMVFTEQGVAMLSSVLRSERAIEVNIAIMRAFVQMRQMLASHDDLRKKIEEMEERYDEQFKIVFQAIHQLLTEEEKPKRKIGF